MFYIMFGNLQSSFTSKFGTFWMMSTEVKQNITWIQVGGTPGLSELQLFSFVCVYCVAIVDTLYPPLHHTLLQRLGHNLHLLLAHVQRSSMLEDDSPLVVVAGDEMFHWISHDVDVDWLLLSVLREVDVVLVLDIHGFGSAGSLLQEVSKTHPVIVDPVPVGVIPAPEHEVAQGLGQGV